MRWFGIPQLTATDGTTVFRAERPYHLLAYLACRGDWTIRDELATLFWPEHDQSAARRNLRKVLLVAERVAGPLSLERQGDSVRFSPDSDLARLEAASAQGRHADVLALYRPPLMEGLDTGLPSGSSDWLAFKRQHVETLWRRAAATRLHEMRDDPDAAANLAETLIAIDPLDETALLALGEACLARGEISRAIIALNAHRRRLAATLDVQPSAELRALADRLQGHGTAPSRTREPRVPRAMPVPPSARFMGRRLELAQLAALMNDPACRVANVIGPGGIGKTSLARTFLADAQTRFDGRAWWVSLGDLQTVDEAAVRLAVILGLNLDSGDTCAQIYAHLARERALVVFDNSEHLDGASEVFAAMTAAAPELKVVVTSRARLAIPGEWLVPLDGLPLPDADETDIEVLRHNDAVRLFEARALASAPSFNLQAQAEDVVRLVHRIEGLPLAIELAAAWTRLLPAAQIADEIDHSLDLLDRVPAGGSGGGKDQSLRASFAWSWSLLTPAQRAALCNLALLPGDFDRAMAANAAVTPLPLLAALVDNSLLRADGTGRFSLHPLLRQCALERVPDTVDAEALARRHVAHMAEWLAGFVHPMRTGSREALAAVDTAIVHVRAAWRSAVSNRQPDLVSRGCEVVLRYFEARGAWSEGIALMTDAVAAFTDDTLASQRARLAAAGALAQLEVRMAQFSRGECSARLALQIARTIGDRAGLKSSVNLIGMALYRQDRTHEARDYFEQSLRYAREDADEPRIAMLCSNLAITETALGHHAQAQALYRESAALARRAGNAPSLAAALNNLATLQISMGDAEAALAAASEALALYTAAGLSSRRALALLNMGEARHQLGDLEEARRLYEDGLATARTSGEPDSLFEALAGSARVAAESPDPAQLKSAKSRLREALALALRIDSPTHVLKVTLVYARVLLSEGNAGRALGLGAWSLTQPGVDPVQAGRWERSAATVSDTRAVALNGTLHEVAAAIEHELACIP
ncbi:MAG: tetratricopeptide repeat protein [Betaproteobacteria bacterium]